jgi:hypothetical protein
MAKVAKVIELLAESLKELGRRRADRGERSLENPAQYPFDLHQGIHRCGGQRQSHELSDQLESHFRPRDEAGKSRG